MAKIIVAFPDKAVTRKIADALESGGYSVFRTCVTGNEVMRAFNQCQDGVLVCAPRFQDRTVDDLAWDLDRQAIILVLGRPEQLENCEHPRLFRIRLPLNRSEFLASVEMLMQLHDQQMPRRSGSQAEQVRKAKALLMREHGYTEQQAHRAIQTWSMRNGAKAEECARRILDGELAEEELRQS